MISVFLTQILKVRLLSFTETAVTIFREIVNGLLCICLFSHIRTEYRSNVFLPKGKEKEK